MEGEQSVLRNSLLVIGYADLRLRIMRDPTCSAPNSRTDILDRLISFAPFTRNQSVPSAPYAHLFTDGRQHSPGHEETLRLIVYATVFCLCMQLNKRLDPGIAC